jgi:large subunit ribosomal protein L21
MAGPEAKSMYAVIRSGGKQYKVAEGDHIRVEKLDLKNGEKIDITDVLFIADGEKVTIGTPLIQGACVSAEVREQGRGDKIRVIKYKRRTNYRRQMGHRQSFTELAITGIKTK